VEERLEIQLIELSYLGVWGIAATAKDWIFGPGNSLKLLYINVTLHGKIDK
jgi:hypothetical protein